jgi:tRNA G18 (ribose-2'-O)-methylase SpoU
VTVGFIRIGNAEDPRLAPYRALRERDLIASVGRYIAEGRFIVEKALGQARFPLLSILILEKHWEKISAMLQGIDAPPPVYVVEPGIMNGVAGFDVHRGILAEGEAIGPTPPAELLASGGDIAVISGVSNPENIGAIFRNAAGLGISSVLLDLQSTHPLARRAIRVSMGTTLTLPWARADSALVYSALAEGGFTLFALAPSAATPLEAVRFPRRAAMIFGEEAHGLDGALLQRVTGLSIPMASGVDSLNVAAASAIAFDALRRARMAR